MIVRATLDGQYLDVRRLPDLSPIETGLGPSSGTCSRSRSAPTVDESPSPPSSRPHAMMVHILDIASGDESIEPIPWPNEDATPSLDRLHCRRPHAAHRRPKAAESLRLDVATRTVSPNRFEGMHGPVVGLWPLRDGRLVAVSHDGTMSIFDATRPTARTADRLDAASRPGVFVLPNPGPRHPPPSRPRPARAAAVEHRRFDVAGGGLPTSRTQPHARRMDPVHARR